LSASRLMAPRPLVNGPALTANIHITELQMAAKMTRISVHLRTESFIQNNDVRALCRKIKINTLSR